MSPPPTNVAAVATIAAHDQCFWFAGGGRNAALRMGEALDPTIFVAYVKCLPYRRM